LKGLTELHQRVRAVRQGRDGLLYVLTTKTTARCSGLSRPS